MLMDIIKAFLVGGALCAVGQLLIDFTNLTPARILTGYVVAGVILSGASVPLTGFGHLLAEGIRKTIEKDGFLGIFTGGLTAAAGGVTAALLFGLIASLIFKQKDKA